MVQAAVAARVVIARELRFLLQPERITQLPLARAAPVAVPQAVTVATLRLVRLRQRAAVAVERAAQVQLLDQTAGLVAAVDKRRLLALAILRPQPRHRATMVAHLMAVVVVQAELEAVA